MKENGVEVDGADAIIQAYQDEFVNIDVSSDKIIVIRRVNN